MWAAIAGHHSVIIIVIVRKVVEQVVAVSLALVVQWHLLDGIG